MNLKDEPIIPYHTYDPGERRKLVRRMDDRVRVITERVRRVNER